MRRGRLLMAGALCLPVLMLSACNDSEQPLGAPSASPAQTLITPHATKAKPSKKPQKTVHSVVKGDASRSKLDGFIAQARLSLDTMVTPEMKKVYSSIRVDPVYPEGIRFTYVFASTPPPGASAKLEAQSATFASLFTSTLAPQMRAAGFAHPTTTFTFLNPNGSLIWTHKFE